MERLNNTINAIEAIDFSLARETQKRLDSLTKPQGSLGRLEELAKKIVDISKGSLYKVQSLENLDAIILEDYYRIR